MEAPKCKICKQRHYGPCFAAAGYANAEHRVAPEVLPVSSPAPATKPNWNKIDRHAPGYMAAYMRGWRKRNKK